MSDIIRVGVGTRLSEIARFQNVLYLAGQVPTNTRADIKGQTTEVLALVEKILTENGSDKSRILFCQIFLADMQSFQCMNQVWDEWVAPGHTPPRATVEAKLASADKLIEVCVTAAATVA